MDSQLQKHGGKLRKALSDLKRKYVWNAKLLLEFQRKRESIAGEHCREKLTPNFFTLLKCNLRNTTRGVKTGKKNGRRYLLEEFVFFLEIYKRSPKLYCDLPAIKPVEKTCLKPLQKLNLCPGVYECIGRALSTRAENLPDAQRDVFVVVDEVSVKICLEYVAKTDSVRSLVDLGVELIKMS